MRAAVFHAYNEPFVLEDKPVPEVGRQDVLVKISSCGICRGDLQRFTGGIEVPLPLVLGHEPAGVVEEVGSEVANVKPGDRVVLFAVGCGECYYCKIGKDNVCDHIAEGFGLQYDGAYAEYTRVPSGQVFKLPDNVPLEAGSVVTASTGTTFHAIRQVGVQPGDTAVIFGVGCLGSQALQLLKFLGARVVVVDVRDEKVELAKKLGADVAINSREHDPVDTVRDLTGGRGADVAFEVIGLPQTINQALDCMRRGGKVVDIGSVMEPVEIRMMPFLEGGLSLTKELTLMTIAHCTQADMTKLMEVLAVADIDFETGTVKVPLDDINHGFDVKKEGKYARVLITP